MQVLYVVELTIRPRAPYYDEYTAAVGGIASWLSGLAGEDVDPVLLAASGARELRPYQAGVARAARWELVGTDDARALRIEVVDTDETSESVFLNRLTLGRVASRTTVRVSMARGSSPTWLSPSPPADLRQPGVVRRLLNSDQIDLFIHEQRQDGRYIQVRLNHEMTFWLRRCAALNGCRSCSSIPERSRPTTWRWRSPGSSWAWCASSHSTTEHPGF